MKIIAFLTLLIGACTSFQPVPMHSDPNQERLERLSEKHEYDEVTAFLAAHPELDAETKKELRNGTITRHEALERLKKQQGQ